MLVSWRVRLPIDCARLTSSFLSPGPPRVEESWCRKGEFSLGVPEPPTKRDTTSSLLPIWGVCGVLFMVVPFSVAEPSMESWGWIWGVAVARDIFVVLWEGVRCNRRSAIILPSVFVRRGLGLSLDTSAFGALALEVGESTGECS